MRKMSEKLQQTGSQTVGPFFHYGLMTRDDFNILTEDSAKGDRIIVTGQVTDGEGQPVPDAMIEIWQADSAGYFNHPADPNQAKADKQFRGFGRADTLKNGVFSFKTVKPGVVTFDGEQDQAPHINVRVFSRGMLIHAYTRLYFGDEEEANTADPVLNLVPEDRRHTLISLKQETGDLPSYCFNIRLQGEDETVFFDP
jgi:protocatechuate 3,4-dioxygenase alpha subunit